MLYLEHAVFHSQIYLEDLSAWCWIALVEKHLPCTSYLPSGRFDELVVTKFPGVVCMVWWVVRDGISIAYISNWGKTGWQLKRKCRHGDEIFVSGNCKMTISGTGSDESFLKMTWFLFPCKRLVDGMIDPTPVCLIHWSIHWLIGW